MEIISNPHDKFFKETLSNIDIARDFIFNYLPKDILNIIDTEEMEIVKDSFIEKNLRETFSDLLYKVKIKEKSGYIYILFEHKSYPYRLISFQLLKYISRIWDLSIKQRNAGKNVELPLVIPLVFYHGKEKWNISPKLSGILEEIPKEINDYMPDFKYILYDLSKYSDEELKGSLVLRIFLELTKNIFTEDIDKKLIEVFSLFKKLEGKETGMQYFEVIIKYILNTRDDLTINSLKEAVKQTIPERSEDIMTLAERLREEGKKEGKIEGQREELMDTIYIQLNKKLKLNTLPDELSGRIKLLEIEQLRRIRDNIFDITSLDDIKKYLN
jgi:predicted transposase/invertase (TIGR01784 family)